MKPAIRRCAVYTRKSSEEGLEQSFNSLDAQREACEAYIKSQAHDGWQFVGSYDDGGFSGGNIQRPGLARLLEDVKGKRVDVIVVYKVDRLTRSLADFAKIVEVLDSLNASFVSVTQQFNTTSSMGRLTLNVLLSFAQFEREVTGERIRDKIAASKRKGMWMGGNIPLGYEVRDRKLFVNDEEASIVRAMFETYVELGTVAKLQSSLKGNGVVRKLWTSTQGNVRGGTPYSRSALYTLLRSPIYVGLIPHKNELHPAQHSPIVPRKLWDRVQEGLASTRPAERATSATPAERLLAGILFDDRGNAMSPSFTRKADGRRYPCYVSQAVLQGTRELAGSVPRIPAAVVEDVVVEHLQQLTGAAGRNRDVKWKIIVSEEIARVIVGKKGIEIVAKKTTKSLMIAGVIIRRGRSLAFERFGRRKSTDVAHPTAALVKALSRASVWREECERGEIKTYYQLSRRTGLAPSYVRANMQLAFLAPQLVEGIIQNRQSLGVGVVDLTSRKLPLSWFQQIAMLDPRRRS